MEPESACEPRRDRLLSARSLRLPQLRSQEGTPRPRLTGSRAGGRAQRILSCDRWWVWGGVRPGEREEVTGAGDRRPAKWGLSWAEAGGGRSRGERAPAGGTEVSAAGMWWAGATGPSGSFSERKQSHCRAKRGGRRRGPGDPLSGGGTRDTSRV